MFLIRRERLFSRLADLRRGWSGHSYDPKVEGAMIALEQVKRLLEDELRCPTCADAGRPVAWDAPRGCPACRRVMTE